MQVRTADGRCRAFSAASIVFLASVLSGACARPTVLVPVPGVTDTWPEYVGPRTSKDCGCISFTIRVPDAKAVQRREQVDFDLYYVHRDESLLLGIYAGNHPSFGRSMPRGARRSQARLNGMRTQEIRWRTSAESLSRHVLVRLTEGPLFPQYVHFWYVDLSPESAGIADAIIHSIRWTPAARRVP